MNTVTDSGEATKEQQAIKGGALGPDWSGGLEMKGQGSGSHHVHVEYKAEVREIISSACSLKLSWIVWKNGSVQNVPSLLNCLSDTSLNLSDTLIFSSRN